MSETLVPTMRLRLRVTGEAPRYGAIQVFYRTWTVLEQCFHPPGSDREIWLQVPIEGGER